MQIAGGGSTSANGSGSGESFGPKVTVL